ASPPGRTNRSRSRVLIDPEIAARGSDRAGADLEWNGMSRGSVHRAQDFALRLDVLVGPTPRDRSDRRAQMAMVGHPQGSNRCPLSEGLDDRGIAVNERRMGAEADWVRPRVTGRRSHRSPEGPPAEPFTVGAIPSGSRSIS